MKKKTLKKVPLGDGTAKFYQAFESDLCEPGTKEARGLQISLLRSIGASAELQFCGNLPFEKMEMYHDGEKWVVLFVAHGIQE